MKQTDAATRNAVVSGDHPDVFSYLGMHEEDGGNLVVRAFLPGARSVVAAAAEDGRSLGELENVHPDGLFAGAVATGERVPYRLRVLWEGGNEMEVAAGDERRRAWPDMMGLFNSRLWSLWGPDA